ncbi:MAG TPA: alpha/beta hydrolase [Pseudomonadales bacterium]|nr:alpha/beta hydrolase [Pseudomonadales bacterium]
MAIFESGEVRLHYEISGSEAGEALPLLLFAPGGMRSAADLWARAPFDPRVACADGRRVIAMDQRNAGASTAPITAAQGWHTYAQDHVALLDHLGIERCLVMGMCIGGPFCLGLAQAAPARVAAAVLLQPIGLDDNRDAFRQMYDAWADDLRPLRPEVDEAAWQGLRAQLFDGDFVFSVSRDFVRACAMPMLVARGDDLYHPASISEEIARIAPDAQLLRDWKEDPGRETAVQQILAFLDRHG